MYGPLNVKLSRNCGRPCQENMALFSSSLLTTDNYEYQKGKWLES